ncbi:Myb/SANT-like DNA-binding domain-containing protein 4 [Merluccius polli]|uniref:Myb/SANT-like DNA-binding domain-containing protein 4 n=1 Tax=Merluccius polli TaxID=89951 RepID=A0AA47MKT7_MERPO|nr:Myb/SANT-like DNA-binding domain-containing protein 4 [Merluccius polli]
MAGVAECKKRRAFNFSQDELEALVQAVEDRKHVLFGKFSVTVTSQSKDSNWKEVADSVSAVCGMLRTVESTKKKWSSLASDAKIRGVLQRRDQAKTGAGLPEVKPLTSLEEKILAVMGQVYTEGIATGTEVGLDELCEQESGEVYQSTLSDPESRRVILTLMDSECDIIHLPPAIAIPSPAKKKKHTGLQEELLELEKEKLLLMREKLNIDKERLQLEKDKFEFMKEYLRNRGNNIFDLSEL